jgi:deubiquitinase
MAINTGHWHWASMMVSKDNDTNKIIFTYNNPLGPVNTINKSQAMLS